MTPHRESEEGGPAGSPASKTSTGGTGHIPTPVLVHLSGPRRGEAVTLTGDEIRVSADAWAIDRPAADVEAPPTSHHAVLTRRGASYELTAEPGRSVWVNGERVDRLVLASGDVLELGQGGAILRFRLYPPGVAPQRSVAEVFSDCVECAARATPSRVGRAGLLLAALPYDLATRTSRIFRVSVLAVLVALGASLWGLAHRSGALEDRLAEVTRQVEIRELVDRSRVEARVTEGELDELVGRLQAASTSLEEIRAQIGAPARVVSAASAATILLQASYGFRDPATERPVRLAMLPDGQPAREPGGGPVITLEGDGPLLDLPYTGTGFVATPEGLILTNRHVALPWEYDASARPLLARGLEPVMHRFLGFLPGEPEPFEVTFVEASPDADLALLRCGPVTGDVPFLRLAEDAPQPGDEVIVVGYPLGIRALMARTDPAFVQELRRAGGADFWSVARRLSERGYVAPLATRGIVGQRTEQFLVYDAETTSGGSGGPVLDMNGRVVAINAAIMPEFGGSNLGVPAVRAAALLERARSRSDRTPRR